MGPRQGASLRGLPVQPHTGLGVLTVLKMISLPGTIMVGRGTPETISQGDLRPSETLGDTKRSEQWRNGRKRNKDVGTTKRGRTGESGIVRKCLL